MRVAKADLGETVLEYQALISAVGWAERDTYVFLAALKRSLAVFVLWHQGFVCAAARLVGDGRYSVVLYDLVVSPKCQRMGFGRAIVEECEQYARRWGAKRIECIADPESAEFYSRTGWDKVPAFRKELKGGGYKYVGRCDPTTCCS